MELTTEDHKALQDAINVLLKVLQQVSPEVPERVDQWPEDDTHLRGEFWEDTDGDIFRFSDGWWEMWSPRIRDWVPAGGSPDSSWAPFTRATDPSLPRTWGTLDDVPEDVESVTGDYAGTRSEFARSPLSETGWFQRAKGELFSGWVELLVGRTKYVKNIKETP